MWRRLSGIVLLAACAGFAENRCDYLVQGAVDTELGPLLAALKDKKETQIGAWYFWTGRIGAKSIVVSRTDAGPINAAASTTLGIERFHPKAIINQGTAGAHNPEYQLYDIVVGEKAIDYSAYKSGHLDLGAGTSDENRKPFFHRLRVGGALQPYTGFPANPELVAAALEMKYTRGKVRKGVIGSAFQFNRELDHIRWLHKAYGTDSEDMESAYAAGVALGLGIPFVAIRIISDSEWNHPAFERIAGQYCAEFVLDFVRR